MARSNKYASLNLNDIFERKLNNTSTTNQAANNSSAAKSFPNQSKKVLANSRIHGHMLVLSRPTPKPISIPQKGDNREKGSSAPPPPAPDQAKGSSDAGSISLRPQGHTGPRPALISPPSPSPISSLPAPVKSDRFVPPHLRPGFVGKKEKPGPELVKGGPGSFKSKPEVRGHRSSPVQGVAQSGLDPIEIRPKSGGGYDPRRRDRELGDLNRGGSGGTRPNSSGL